MFYHESDSRVESWMNVFLLYEAVKLWMDEVVKHKIQILYLIVFWRGLVVGKRA